MESFAAVIRELMLRRGISQTQIARTIRVDRSRVSEWTRGPAVPSPKVLERLAENYGLDLDRLMRICNYRIGRPLFATDPDELEALVLYRQIPPELRAAAKAMMRGLRGLQVVPSYAASYAASSAAANSAATPMVNHPLPRFNIHRGQQQPPFESRKRHPMWTRQAARQAAVRALISAAPCRPSAQRPR